MFERRLRILLALFAVPMLVIFGRLVQLQVVQGAHYEQLAARALSLTPRQIPFVRGSILDRAGRVLVRDEPAWTISVEYDVIAAAIGDDETAMTRMIKRLRRNRSWRAQHGAQDGTDETLAAALRREWDAMWSDIDAFTHETSDPPDDTARRRARAAYERVSRIRRVVARRRGFDAPVAEENASHPIVRRLGSREMIAARDVFRRYPWVHVVPSSLRKYADETVPLAHVLGRVGRVDATDVRRDPNADDPFAKYRADERVGITGVEKAAERLLRGRRGQLTTDRDGRRIDEACIAPQNGRDVRLTLDAALQRRLYRMLGDVVDTVEESSGGAVVVLDIPTRDVLALVSYPSYDPDRFAELYPRLRDDTQHLPLRFRAVANRYAPGSTIKPLTCLAALNKRLITLDTRQTCTGYLIPGVYDQWRCWPIHGTNRRKAHGNINVVEALVGSCNVFMYRLGEGLGVRGLCQAFEWVGIGQETGIGLIEEATGINPTPSWLAAHKNERPTRGLARQYAIGQGEVAMTPLQVANLMATYATGVFRPVRLLPNDRESPEWKLPGAPEHWLAIRRGIYGVVNDPDGTAYKYARINDEHYALCGKTGSATAHRWPTAFLVPYRDDSGHAQSVRIPAGAKREAIEKFSRRYPGASFDPAAIEVASRWPPDPPPDENRYSHAWFAGFLQAIDPLGRPIWSRTPRLAFAVLVEFGGSGSRTTGPLAARVARELLSVYGPDLELGD